MYPRTNYAMTEEQLAKLLEACKPVPAMMIGGYAQSQQENANNAWAALGSEMGFDDKTVQGIAGKGNRFFSAIPSETPEAKAEREARQEAEAKTHRITQIKNDIANLQKKLATLEDQP